MKTLKIQKGRDFPYLKDGHYNQVYPMPQWDELESGDSVLVKDTGTQRGHFYSLRQMARIHGFRCRSKREGENRRVWFFKKDTP